MMNSAPPSHFQQRTNSPQGVVVGGKASRRPSSLYDWLERYDDSKVACKVTPKRKPCNGMVSRRALVRSVGF